MTLSGNDFLARRPKAQATNRKVDKMKYVKMKTSLCTKGHYQGSGATTQTVGGSMCTPSI